jgi:hypothetical protein
MRTTYAVLFLGMAFAVWAPRSEAIPLFAHKYNTTCFTCHTTPPLLNEFGRRFQANGYQLPGTVEKIALWDQPTFAFGAVAQPMVFKSQVWDNRGDSELSKSFTFSGIEVGLFSSASLGKHFSYFAAVPVAIEDGNTSISIETANLMYTDVLNDGTGSLNLRLGKFRFLMPFQDIVMLTNPGVDPAILVNGYDAFDGMDKLVKANDLAVGDGTFGASAFGIIPVIAEGLRWEAGVTGGNSSDIDLNTAKAYFLALDQTIFLDNAPVRFGGFFYRGSQDVTDTSLALGWTNNTTRMGVSAEFYDPWTKRLDFFGQYMLGKDDNVDTVGALHNMSGGFAGVNVIVLPEKLYVYGRYDFMTFNETPAGGDKTDLGSKNQIDLGIQYHLLPNVFLTGVYTIGKETAPNSTDQTTTTMGAGVRFGF